MNDHCVECSPPLIVTNPHHLMHLETMEPKIKELM